MNLYHFLLVLLLLEVSYGVDDDPCQIDDDCVKKDNNTRSCCYGRYDSHVCKESCLGEPCTLMMDCGTAQTMVCCNDHICRSSFAMCSAPKWPTWIIAVVVAAVVCAVLGIGGAILCIYFRQRNRLHSWRLLDQNSGPLPHVVGH